MLPEEHKTAFLSQVLLDSHQTKATTIVEKEKIFRSYDFAVIIE